MKHLNTHQANRQREADEVRAGPLGFQEEPRKGR